MRQFSPGQLVKFLNEVGSATVLRVEGSQVVVTDEDGFDRTVEAHELIHAPDPETEAKNMGKLSLIWPSFWPARWERRA